MLKKTRLSFLLINRLARSVICLSYCNKLVQFADRHKFQIKNAKLTNQIAFYSSNKKQATSELLNNIIKELSQAQPGSFPIANHYVTIATLPQSQRQIVVKYTLAAIYKKKIGFEDLPKQRIKNFNMLLSEYPEQELQLNLWLINNLQHQKKQKGINQLNVQQLNARLNDMYLYCYQKILPKISEEDKKIRAQAVFYKFFGKHLANNLIAGDPYSSKQSLEGLNKSKKFLSASIDNFKQIIKRQMKKTESEEMETQRKQNPDKFKIRISAIKQNIRKLVEATGQTAYSLFTIVYQKSQQTSSEDIQKQKLTHLEDVLFILQDCLKLFSLVYGIKTHSIFYHRLKRIYLEIKGVLYIKKPSEQFKKLSIVPLQKQLVQFYGECQANLMEALEYPQIVKQITICMVTTRYHILRGRLQIRNENDLKIRQEKLKEEMMDWCSQLLKKVDVQYKNSLMRMLAQVIKILYNKKLSKK